METSQTFRFLCDKKTNDQTAGFLDISISRVSIILISDDWLCGLCAVLPLLSETITKLLLVNYTDFSFVTKLHENYKIKLMSKNQDQI